MDEQRIEIRSDGLTLSGILSVPATEQWPLVVLCHGMLSHKDSSKYRQLSNVFTKEGIGNVRFDFRGCGDSEGSLEESTVSERWSDLKMLLEWATDLEGFNGHLGLLGSSLGGYLALLEASRNSLIRCVVVWATPSHLNDLADRLPDVLPFPLSKQFYEDLTRVELISRLKDVRRVMILHGGQDHQIPPEHASTLLGAVGEPKSLRVFEKGDHRFSKPEDRDQAARLSVEWFKRYL